MQQQHGCVTVIHDGTLSDNSTTGRQLAHSFLDILWESTLPLETPSG